MFSRRSLALAGGLSTLVLLASRLAAADQPGLAVHIRAGDTADQLVLPNIRFLVPPGQPASPFVAPGPFTATWNGYVASELRSDYDFHVELTGEVRLEINGTEVLTGKGDGSTALDSPTVRLNKGDNALKVTWTSPSDGTGFIRLYWSNRETPRNPMPVEWLTHDTSPELEAAQEIHRGRDLFAEHQCVKCHTAPGGMAELAADAPALTGIGSRRRFDWMARWIADPAAVRPGTPMPRLLHGPDAASKAEAIAAYLASLGAGTGPAAVAGDVAAGGSLYEKLLCASCHVAPDGSGGDDEGKISQKGVKAKFTPGALAAFLRQPEANHRWIRMPNFRLAEKEAADLAAYLESHADEAADRSAPTDPALIARGRELVGASGCLNCHSLDGSKSTLAAAPLSELAVGRWSAGCVADAPAADSKAPWYGFDEPARKALRAFAATDRTSLARHSDADFLLRQSDHLQCRACHGQQEEFPSWEILGGKLKPEWAAGFIAGTEPVKPRPWLEARMPGFPAYADGLARGLATAHGFPVTTPAEPAPSPADAENGRKLVSANGGFSCTSCHGVADFGATAVFEAPGINLAISHRRLQQEFFQRWLRSPLSVDPHTKMPGYFDEEGNSPLPEFYEGNGPKTIQAVWEYLRLGDQMPRPE